MPNGTAIIILGLGIAGVVALAFAPTVLVSSRALRRRFGPEFQLVLDHHGGEVKAARKELSKRLYQYGDLPVQPLSAAAREQYVREWAEIHLRWLNAPAEAVVQAEGLLFRLAADRGFPGGDAKQLGDALSVRHPRQVAGFRRLHEVAQRVRSGDEKTVGFQGVLSGSQELFEQLAEDRPRGRGRGRGPGSRTRFGMTGRPRQRPRSAQDGTALREPR